MKLGVDGDAIDDAARFAGWRLVNIIPGDTRHPRQLLFSVFEGGWLYLVDDARFAQRWFQAEGPRRDENLARVRALLDCEAPGAEPQPAAALSRTESEGVLEDTSGGIPRPHRPRLADHVLPRLHVMGGSAHLLLHDNLRGDALELEPEQFEWLELADGTRDEEGLCLEASRRGLLHKRSQIRDVLSLLHSRGELAGGIPGEQQVPRFEDRPIRPLPGLELGCDGNGSCCRTYSSMLFDADEVEAARGIAPPGLTKRHGRVFLPAFGADPSIQAVATRDGECVFLEQDSSCALHPRDAKPRGCRTYPLTLVDDGAELLAVPVFECPCVERSFLKEIETRVPSLPSHEAGLPPERPITRLRDSFLLLEGGEQLSLEQLRSWRSTALESIPAAMDRYDPLHWLWSWGQSCAAQAISAQRDATPSGATPSVQFDVSPPATYEMAPWVQRLLRYAERRVESAAWRAPQDRTRCLVEWMLTASQELLSPQRTDELLRSERGAAQHQAGVGVRDVPGVWLSVRTGR